MGDNLKKEKHFAKLYVINGILAIARKKYER